MNSNADIENGKSIMYEITYSTHIPTYIPT